MDASTDAPAHSPSPVLTGSETPTNTDTTGPRTRRRTSLATASCPAANESKPSARPSEDDSDLSDCNSDGDGDGDGDKSFATAKTSIEAPENDGEQGAVKEPTEATQEQTKEEQPPENKEEEEEDIGEILPAEWSGKVPIFRPTMRQFKDFKKFMEAVDKYGMTSGIIKIVPPAEWKQSQPPIDHLVKQVRVRNPIKQDIMGSSGTYRQVNFVHGRIYNVPQWRALCDQSEHQPPARRGERRANAERPRPALAPRKAATASSSSAKTDSTTTTGRRKRGRPVRRSTRNAAVVDDENDDHDNNQRPITPVSTNDDHEHDHNHDPDNQNENENDSPIASIEQHTPAPRSGRMRATKAETTQSTSARRKYSRREGSAKIDEEAFRNFDYNMDISEFTPERCEELERIYWKTLTYAPPLYGADLMGTLFDESTELWNLNKLPNLLDVLGTKVPGVNTAYLYLGMWKATFAWHLEDVDLYSINYLHFGAPKQWYSISQADARRFEAAMKAIWPQEAKSCDQFLRHKGFLISPQHLKSHFNITVNKVLSYPGEFVVTYPYGYHSGYNLGYNCAEAVNFALDTWLPMGKIAKKCECAEAQDSVWVDVYEIERKLRGEEEHEYVEMEVDDDDDDNPHGIPSPPDSSNDKVGKSKRKRGNGASGDKPAKKVKTVRIQIKSKNRADPVCCLCPNDIRALEVLPTDDGRTAHRMCARYLPETYFDEAADGSEVICGIDAVMAARHDLKCLFCHSKRGACIQCSQNNCSRVYHATCAAASGAFVEEAQVPVFGADGTEYKEEAFEVSCRFHRVRRDRGLTGYDLENSARTMRAAAALQPGDICQLQLHAHAKDVFAGVVVENRHDEEMLMVEAMPNRDLLEVQWKWLVVADPADFHLPRASPNAVAMPRSKAARDALGAVRGDGAAPRRDEPFVAGYTWAEFVVNHAQAGVRTPAVDVVSPATKTPLWLYLGSASTDSRAQYTHDWSMRRPNAAAEFLASVPACAGDGGKSRKAKREARPKMQPQPQQPVVLPSAAVPGMAYPYAQMPPQMPGYAGLVPRFGPVGGLPMGYVTPHAQAQAQAQMQQQRQQQQQPVFFQGQQSFFQPIPQQPQQPQQFHSHVIPQQSNAQFGLAPPVYSVPAPVQAPAPARPQVPMPMHMQRFMQPQAHAQAQPAISQPQLQSQFQPPVHAPAPAPVPVQPKKQAPPPPAAPMKQTPVPLPAKYLTAALHKPSPPPGSVGVSMSTSASAPIASPSPAPSAAKLGAPRLSTTPIPIPRVLGMSPAAGVSAAAGTPPPAAATTASDKLKLEDDDLADVPPESMELVDLMLSNLRRVSVHGGE